MTTEVRSGTPLIDWELGISQTQPERSDGAYQEPEWLRLAPNTYQCHVRITTEEDGFSVNMPSLPGVVSEGDTEEEAIANISEAFQCIVESYRKDGEEIPWTSEPEPADSKTKEVWIVVHV